MGSLEVCSVHLGQRLAMLTDGQILPIAKFIDEDGDETPDALEAVHIVTGPDKDGREFSDNLASYGKPRRALLN